MTSNIYSTIDYLNWRQNSTNGYDVYNDYNATYAYDDGHFVTTHTIYNGSFNDTSQEQPQDNIFILPVWRQVLWIVLFAGMVVVATVGNLVVIWIVLAHKRMRTVTNYFLVNLSIADTMVSTLNVTFNFVYMLNSDWPFGTLYCKISQFVAILSICASVFTLMAIAIDRYMAIMNPLKPRMGKRATLCIAVLIWIFGIILSCPNLVFFTTYDLHLKNGEVRIVCYAEWPDGPTNHSLQEYLYNLVFMFLTYFLPIGSMSYTYARVGLELWGSQSIGECTQRQLDNIKSKRKVVLMMMIVVLIFAVCWLPQNVYFILTSYFPQVTNSDYIQEVYLGIYWLAMSNSMYNPIIYCWMNSRFRRGFKQVFRCFPCVHLGPEIMTRREVVTSRYSCSGSPDHHRIIRNDTERSFLYTCPTSPKNNRKSLGSVRIPMQNSKSYNHGSNQTHLSMNTFNNNILTVPSNNNETTNMTQLDDSLVTTPNTTTTNHRWTTSRNVNGSQRSTVS